MEYNWDSSWQSYDSDYEWCCPSLTCGMFFDVIYLVSELCWYSKDEDLDDPQERFTLYTTPSGERIPFYPDRILRDSPLLSLDVLCCDETRSSCRCGPIKEINQKDPVGYFDSIGLNMDDYAYDPSNINMCHYCEFQNTWRCVPLRNFIRFHHTHAMFPEPLTECSKYEDWITKPIEKQNNWDDEYEYDIDKSSTYTEE